MRYTLLFILISIGTTYSQMTGLWNLDWQSQGLAVCAPAYLNITNTSQNASNTTYSVRYTYTSLAGCPNNFTGSYTSNLSLSSNGTYNDSRGNQLVYDPVNQVIYGILGGQTYLFDRSGSYFAQGSTLGPIGGLWANATLINASNVSQCCVPDSFLLYPSVYPGQGSVLNIQASFSSNCTTVRSKNLNANISPPSISKLSWITSNVVSSDYAFLSFNPNSTASNFTFAISYLQAGKVNNTCTYSYKKLAQNTTTWPNGTWMLDWQTPSSLAPTYIQVTNVNNAYLTSTFTYWNGTTSSFFVPTGSNLSQYINANTNQTYTYSPSTNTFTTSGSILYPTLLYSQNGSYLSDDMFGSYWINPQSTTKTPLPSYCCIPEWLSITPTNGNAFSVDYYLPSNYTKISGCEAILTETYDGEIQRSLYLANAPSLTSLEWSDGDGTTMYFNGPALIVSGFADGNCTFKMSYTWDPPVPLSSQWMSLNVKSIVGFVAMILVQLLAI